MESQAFSQNVDAILAEGDAYPIEFFHESERRVGFWKTIGVSFFPWRGGSIFQDVPDGLAHHAGVQPGPNC